MKAMNLILSIAVAIIFSYCKQNSQAGDYSMNAIRIVKKDLHYPWEIIWGSDNHIWMTEREGTITRINPATGYSTFSFRIPDAQSINEGGLLGMVLHPDFNQNGFLYVVYNYNYGSNYLEKLVRYTYANNTLNNPFILLDGIQGSSIHNGSRLWITHEPNPKIFITTGDASDQSLPQQINSVNGKVLRLNLDGSVPADNPFPGNAVWSFGHRNAQGLVMVNNILYASEHGPESEDEVNIIEKGRNYGWPEVKGPCNGLETNFCSSNNVREPIWSSGSSTIAVCGLEYYNNERIPQWKSSLLMMTLKNSSIEQLKLSSDGRSIVQSNNFFKNEWGRLRDICISPDGKVYICTSNGNNDLLIEISGL